MLGERKANIRLNDFKTAPSDKYTVLIADVNYKMKFNRFKNVEEEMLNFKYIILDEKPMPEEKDGMTRGVVFTHAVSQSLGSGSWLMKLAKAVLGRDLTKEELNQESPKFFNPESLVGKQVDVMITEDPNKDGTAMFNNVQSYIKNVRPLKPVEISNAGQTVVESVSQPTTKVAEVPDLNPGLNTFISDVEKGDEGDKSSGNPESSEEAEESLEELELKLKRAKEKKKEALKKEPDLDD